MLEDKIRATDWEATSEAIEEQIARESYLEWLRENEMRSRKKTSATSTLTDYAAQHTTEDNNNIANTSSPKCYSPRASSKSPLQDRDLRSPKRSNALKYPKEMTDSAKSISSKQNINENLSFIHQVPSSALGKFI